MNNRFTSKAIFSVVALFIVADAHAMYHPTAGRWMQRDRLGYIDGANLYAAFFVVHGRFDAFGTTTCEAPADCWCADHPDDCFLEYESLGKPLLWSEYYANGGWDYKYNKSFFVKLKSKSGKDTCGCHISQSAIEFVTYVNSEDAKPKKPEDFGKEPDDPGFFSFKPWIFPNVVVSGDIDDYVPEDTQCVDGIDQINDYPGYSLRNHESSQGRFVSYKIGAIHYVIEAPEIQGHYHATVDYDYENMEASWTAKSSDGKINESGEED